MTWVQLLAIKNYLHKGLSLINRRYDSTIGEALAEIPLILLLLFSVRESPKIGSFLILLLPSFPSFIYFIFGKLKILTEVQIFILTIW